MPRIPPASLITAWILVIAIAACDSNTTPRPVATQPRDLGAETFLSDVLGETAGDLDEVDSLADATDVADESGRGRACQLLVGDCEPGLKCTPDAAGAATCQPLPATPVAAGAPCGQRGLDDCDAGLLCYAASDSAQDLRCADLCNPADGSGCSEGLTCAGPLAWLQTPVGVCSSLGE